MESSWQSWRRKRKHHQNKVVNCSLRWSNLQQQHENKRCTLLKHLWISAALGRGLGLGVMLGRLRRTFQYVLQPFLSLHILSHFHCYSRVNIFTSFSFLALFRCPQYFLSICCHKIILFTSDGHRHHLVLVSRESGVLAEYDGSNSPKERLPFAISLTNILNNFLYRSLVMSLRAMGDWGFTAYCRQACSTNLQIVRRQCSLSYCPKLETF